MQILHLLATRTRRGGELFASDLVGVLEQAGLTQQVAVLHDSEGSHVSFQAPVTTLGGARSIPLLRLDGQAIRGLRRLVDPRRFDVVQAHGGEVLKHLVLAGISRRVPVVYRRIGAAPGWIAGGPRRLAHSYLMGRAVRVVTVAEALRRETIELFHIPPTRVVTIPNAVDADRLKPTRSRNQTRQALGIPPHAPVILSLGALTWEKDPGVHVEVSDRVLHQLPNAVHLMAGDGPLRRQIEADTRRRRLDGAVRILGSRDDVPDLLAASDALLLCSAVEGMPGSAIEAGMAGLPVVGYALAGVPEVVEDGVTGRLVPSGDVGALARNLVDLLTDGEDSRAMGDAAERRCRALFDIQKVGPRYMELYREVGAE
jgi:glycosyltransferase involved in cell wall biosynthesis